MELSTPFARNQPRGMSAEGEGVPLLGAKKTASFGLAVIANKGAVARDHVRINRARRRRGTETRNCKEQLQRATATSNCNEELQRGTETRRSRREGCKWKCAGSAIVQARSLSSQLSSQGRPGGREVARGTAGARGLWELGGALSEGL